MVSNLIKDDYTVSCDSLANQKITTEADAKPISDAIRAVAGIRTLKLEGISLGIEAAKAISNAIAESPTMQVLLHIRCFLYDTNRVELLMGRLLQRKIT